MDVRFGEIRFTPIPGSIMDLLRLSHAKMHEM
jgi:hypothetical protein